MRVTRRRMLLVTGATVGTGLLAASGAAQARAASRTDAVPQAVVAVLGPVAPKAAAPRTAFSSFAQAAQTGFAPIASALTFGAPTDLASGWDGTVWAIDQAGAPHVYDPVGDSWQLHGAGVDGAALINNTGPAVYFRGGEVFVADGKQSSAQPIGQVWPDLPPSFKQGVQGAAWANGSLYLFRGGTYLPVALPSSLAAAAVTATATPTAGASATATATGTTPATPASTLGTPTAAATPLASPTAAGTRGPTGTREPGPTDTRPSVGALFHAALMPVAAVGTATTAATSAASRTSAATASPTASASATATGAATPSAVPSATGTPSAVATATPTVPATPAATVSTTPSPTTTATPAATATPSPTVAGTPGGTATAGPTAAATGTPVPLRDAPAGGWPASLTSMASWPQTPTWKDGVIDGVFSNGSWGVCLLRGSEFVTVDLASGTVATAPAPLSQHPELMGSVPADWLKTGVDAGFVVTTSGLAQGQIYAFKGAVAVTRANSGRFEQHYIAAVANPWPASWHPVLQHAPSGRVGGLWAATVAGAIVSHDGTGWAQQPGASTSVATGADGSVFSVDQQDSRQVQQWQGGSWQTVAQHSSALSQVAVGDSGHVWARDSGNAVHQLDQGQLQPVPLVGAAVHLAANRDGTVWSCNGSDPQAFRFISEASAAPQAIAAAASVHKVASTGFGQAHCLAKQGDTTQLYRYQSPYLFKTSHAYQVRGGEPLEQGLGNLYLLDIRGGDLGPDGPPTTYTVVVVDAHTGQEVSRSATAPKATRYTAPIFDPVHDIVIVGIGPAVAGGSGSQLLGLDARDLTKVRWSITPPNGMAVGTRPMLQGRLLCFTDNVNTIAVYDTGAAQDATPNLRWSNSVSIAPADQHCLPTPVIANGRLYAAWWVRAPDALNYQQLWLIQANASDGQGFGRTAVNNSRLPPFTYFDTLGNLPPLLAQVSDGKQTRLALFANGGSAVWQVDVAAPETALSFALAGDGSVRSGFTFADSVLWFGDSNGTLYGLDGQMHSVPMTPISLRTTQGPGGEQLYTTPVVYRDAGGGSVVLAAVTNTQGANNLVAFDPATGNVAGVPTAQTAPVTLSKRVTNGVVYVAGTGTVNATQQLPQVLGIRVDQAVQSLRAFVIESQLMQDFDDQSKPDGLARYQTHVTLVDQVKAPLAQEAVKVWADKPTSVLINGRTYAIGPGDAQFAAVQTAADGTLVIASGYTSADGSDKPDLYAAPLRVWAGFMDPYERIVVYRDREFHNRVATAQSVADTGSPAYDDPTTVNLHASTSYKSTALFSDADKQQGQPENVAKAIQTMTKSVGTAGAAGGAKQAVPWAVHATPAANKYIPYADLPGSAYAAVNTPAVRTAVVLQPAGLSYASNDARSVPASFAPLTPADATRAIDALQGQDWHTSVHATPRVRAAAQGGTLHLGGWWGDFWGWVKSAAATITHVIVSVAEDVYAGIRFVVDGIAHVFRAIITGIEDVASAIGTFFIQLGKLIEEVIEALSVLFHFEEIIKTHNILKAEILKLVNGVPGDARYVGFAAAVKNTARPKLDAFFGQQEKAVSAFFNKLADDVSGQGVSLTGVKGQGATAHTALNVPPKGGGQPSSQAVQGSWGMQKLKSGLGASGGQALARTGALRATANPLSAFLDSFATSIGDNGPLKAQWAQVQQGLQNLGHSSSVSDFVSQGVAELLKIVGLLVDGALAISNAFLDGLLGAIDALLATLLDANSGVLTAPLDIPVLSWLYQKLFGEPLTILNALTLVAAIPVTMVWRVAKGGWPSQSFAAQATARVGVGDSANVLVYMLDMFGGFVAMFTGFGAAAADTGLESTALNAVLLTSGLVTAAINFPLISASQPDDVSWAAWAALLGTGALGIFGVIPLAAGGPAATVLNYLLPVVTSLLNIAQLAVAIFAFQAIGTPQVADNVAFALGIATTVAGIVNPVKLGGELAALVVAAVDVLMGFATGALLIIAAYQPSGVTGPRSPLRAGA